MATPALQYILPLPGSVFLLITSRSIPWTPVWPLNDKEKEEKSCEGKRTVYRISENDAINASKCSELRGIATSYAVMFISFFKWQLFWQLIFWRQFDTSPRLSSNSLLQKKSLLKHLQFLPLTLPSATHPWTTDTSVLCRLNKKFE